MTDNVSVSSPIEIKDSSRERVAYDLMIHIAYQDDRAGSEQTSRDYWLTLYRQCWKAANGSKLERVLKED